MALDTLISKLYVFEMEIKRGNKQNSLRREQWHLSLRALRLKNLIVMMRVNKKIKLPSSQESSPSICNSGKFNKSGNFKGKKTSSSNLSLTCYGCDNVSHIKAGYRNPSTDMGKQKKKWKERREFSKQGLMIKIKKSLSTKRDKMRLSLSYVSLRTTTTLRYIPNLTLIMWLT